MDGVEGAHALVTRGESLIEVLSGSSIGWLHAVDLVLIAREGILRHVIMIIHCKLRPKLVSYPVFVSLSQSQLSYYDDR